MQIKDLKQDKRNYRTHNKKNLDLIKKSVKEVGLARSIVIDNENNIICGNGLTSTLDKNTPIQIIETDGTELVVVKRTDLKTNDEKRKQLAIMDNSTSDSSEFDLDSLQADFDVEQLQDWGLDLEFEAVDEEKEIVEDEVPEEVETRAKLGDIWQLGNNRLMCGDSTSITDVEKLMDGAKADMVFTDPPYGINVVGDNGEVGANFGVAKKGNYSKVIADDTTETAQQSYNILQSLCKKIILWGGNYFIDFLPFSDGWIIWDKRVDSGIKNTFADGEMAWCSFHTPVRIYHQLWNGMIREGEHEKRVHPTQKPIKLLSDILKDFTREDETVLDVFGGSGSTLIACEQLNRKCYMMELDPKYCDVILQRWENLTGKKAELLNG